MRFLPVLLILVCLLGCKHDPSIVGKWTGTLVGYEVDAEFKEDKTSTISPKGTGMGADFTATYEVDPKNLTLTLKDYKLKGVDSKLEGIAKGFVDPLKGKVFKTTYHFNSEDELAVTYNGKTDVMKRVKDAGA